VPRAGRGAGSQTRRSSSENRASTPLHQPVLKRLFSVAAVTSTVPGAILQQVHDWPDEWGRKRLGFEKRLGSLYGQFVIGVLIEDGVKPSITRIRGIAARARATSSSAWAT